MLQGTADGRLYLLNASCKTPESRTKSTFSTSLFAAFNKPMSSNSWSKSSTSQGLESVCNRINKTETLQRKFSHPSAQTLKDILVSYDVSNNINKISVPKFCTICQYGKSHILSHTSSETKTKEPLELLYLDIWGPALITSRNNYKYYFSIVDDHSRFTWIYALTAKSETFTTFQVFKKMIEINLKRKIRTLQTDWG